MTKSVPGIGRCSERASNAETTGPAGWMTVLRCVSSKSKTCELMPFISDACSTSIRWRRPRIEACGGPENGASAPIAASSVSCRDPPTAQPIQLSSVRCASFRTGAGMSA